MSYAGAVRRGILAAARLHKQLGLKAQAAKQNGRVDVFSVAVQLNVPLLFKPLDGLLGAYLGGNAPGVLVTTKRPLSVQRFTAAHELGHQQLAHMNSFDDETILTRTPLSKFNNGDLQEVEANAFAAEFLLPRWLMTWHCDRQGWTDKDLQIPAAVYQLSVRVGMSYAATCWTLHRHRVLDRAMAQQIAAVEPKALKKTLLNGVVPEDFYGDVWLLTRHDEGLMIEGGPSDLLVVRLPEHSNAGYLWQLDSGAEAAFEVLADAREDNESPDSIGGLVTRRITARSRRQQSGQLMLAELRPWAPTSPLATFDIRYDLTGAETEGFSRVERRHRLVA
jgi:Zn-dependent peptidase ImmA (M78 family)